METAHTIAYALTMLIGAGLILLADRDYFLSLRGAYGLFDPMIYPVLLAAAPGPLFAWAALLILCGTLASLPAVAGILAILSATLAFKSFRFYSDGLETVFWTAAIICLLEAGGLLMFHFQLGSAIATTGGMA